MNSRGGLSGDNSLVRKPVKFYKCELNPEELLLRQQAQWVQFLSTPQLNRLKHQTGVDPVQIARVKHGRFAFSIVNIILLLLGMSFFLHRLPEGVLTQGAQALATCSIIFIVTFVGQNLVNSPNVDPALPAWLPIFIFLPLAVVLLDKVKT